ncbi:MAG: hypothetical protein HDS49_05285 [Bacteroides sp.]|nr:hypothetical protein [Bacteroides sp.]
MTSHYPMRRLVIAGAVIFASIVGGCSRPQVASHDFPDEVKSVADALIADSASAFASAVSYPLDRPYPLRSISDSAQMVRYYNTMVDDSLRHIVMEAPDSLWGLEGWRGWTLDNGEYFWIDSGKLYSMDYISEGEQLLLDSLRSEEIASLVPSMRKGWQPVTCVVDSSAETVFRIDRMIASPDTLPADSSIYRLAVYPISRLDSIPDELLYGHLNPEGSMGSRIYHFGDTNNISADFTPDLLDDPAPALEITNKGVTRSYNAQRGYWLDLIRPFQRSSSNARSISSKSPAEGLINGLVERVEQPAAHNLEVDSAR